jgi:hypothetical protein
MVICYAGCRHRATSSNPSPPPASGANLVVEFAWVASPEDNLGTTRTVILSGRQVSMARDSRFVSCFGAGKKVAGCQAVGEFGTTSAYTPGLEFDGTETITNAQLGRWEVSASAESSGGASASETCSLNIDSNRLITVKMTLGADAGCAVQ